MDSGNQTEDKVTFVEDDKTLTVKMPLQVEPDPNFITVSAKDHDAVDQAIAGLNLEKKVLIEDIGLNSSELIKLNNYATKKNLEIFMNINVI